MTRMMSRSGRFLARAIAPAALAAALAGSPAAAQTWPGTPTDLNLPPSLQTQVARQPQIRVAGTWGCAVLNQPWVAGRTLGYESLSAYTPSSPDSSSLARPLPLQEVAVIERRVDASRTGVLVGAVLGTLAGIALGIGMAQGSTGPSASFNTGGEALGGGLAGAMFGCAVGSVTGAVIGRRVSGWQVMYAKPN
jgi:hypothetical protein